MNWRRNWKRLIALAVAFAMMFSTMGAAAAKTIELDVQPAVTEGTEPETEEEAKKEAESEAEEETEEEPESESEEETEEETAPESEEETEEEPGSESEEESEEETETESEKETEEETEPESEEETEEEPESESEEETEEEPESESEEETEEEPESESEEETEEEPESESEEETEEETETDTEKETEKESGTEAGEETKAEPEKETGADKPLEDSNNQLSAKIDPPNVIPAEESMPDVHRHDWSADWNYDESHHWHECDADGCPVTDNSKKDGYAEHRYSADNICIDCGYFNPESQIALFAEGAVPTYQEAYDAMIALKDQYPEGMEWTNFTPYGSNGPLGDSYIWHGGYIYGANRGVGCSAFAFILSDEAFGNLPARVVNGFTFEDVKVGDIMRVNNNSHSVIVLQKSAEGVVVAEANYNKSVHWGRVISKTEVLNASFIITRYPKDYIPEDDPDADEVAQDGTAGKLKWSLTNGGVLTISGNGAIPDYSPDNLPLWSEGSVSTIVMEKGVTGIGDYAFYQSGALSVYIPDGVEGIGANAFEGSGLISVTIPGTVGHIGNDAFHSCANLTSVTVSKGVETIGERAFYGCTSLAYIDFPASITSVGAGAFMSCSEMTRVRFMPGSGTVEMGDNLFSQCWHLTSVTLPQTADRISAGMFQSCTVLPSLYIPASVKEIGENPFTSCQNLKYIYFGGSEAEWKGITNPYLDASLKSTGTTVVFDAEFDDPFAADPNDPGDFLPDEENPADPDDGNKPTEPDGGNKPADPDPGDSNKPAEPDGGNKPADPDPGDSNKPAEPDGGNKPADPDGGGSVHRHDWSESWNYDPAHHWHECVDGCFITDNRDKDGYGTHLYGSWVTDVSATAFRNGSRHRDCTVCHYRQTENIPAAGSSGGSNDNAGSSGGSSSGSGGSTGSSGKSGNRILTTIRKNADGSSTVRTTEGDGTVATTTTDASGKVNIEVKLSDSAVSTAKQRGQAVSLPISPVQVAQDAAMALAITVYTGSEPAKVAIPVASPTAGTVAVLVNADGSTEVIKASAPAENSVVAYLPDGATVKLVDNRKSFPDVPAGAWFEDAAAFVSARELFYDTAESGFAPDAPMTYAVLMTALAGFDGAETDGGITWYAKSMEWAAARGVSGGSNPEGNIACGELLTALWKYLGSPEAADYSGSTGTGAVGIGEAQKAMNWAAESGIVSGFENGSLDPQGPISRAQSAQIMMNFIKYVTLNPGKQ